MLYIVITLGVVLNVSVWAMVYAEHKREVAIDQKIAEQRADFIARWSWDITKEEYWPRLKAQCDESKRRIAEYHQHQEPEYKESVRLSSILS